MKLPKFRYPKFIYLQVIQLYVAKYERGGDCIIQIWFSKAAVMNRDSRMDRFYLKRTLIISGIKTGMSLSISLCLNDLSSSFYMSISLCLNFFVTKKVITIQ